jgi:hypothetical protein
MSLIRPLTPMSPSSEHSSHRSGYLTDSPRWCHRRMEEEHPHLHTEKIQQEQSLSDYAQQDLSVVTQKP